MKTKLSIIIPSLVGITAGLFIVTRLNKAIKGNEDMGLVLSPSLAQQDVLQSVIFGIVALITMVGCVVFGYIIAKKYKIEVKSGIKE